MDSPSNIPTDAMWRTGWTGARAMVTNWPLIGRREELSIINRALGEGQFRGLLLAGTPGVGKTRLAREALAAAGVRG